MKYLVVIIFCILSCTSGPKYQKVDPNMAYQTGSLSIDWFLPTTPEWINFSPSFQCEKEFVWTFLDISKISPQLGLNYFKSLELQARINQFPEFSKIPENERFKIFSDELTKVLNGVVLFPALPVQSKELTIMDIDLLKASKNWKKELLKIAELPKWNTQIPIIVSECLSTQTLKTILSELPSNHPFQWVIGGEYQTIFSSQGLNKNQWGIEWDKFFPDKKITQFSFASERPVGEKQNL
jgi:hypothetical protein